LPPADLIEISLELFNRDQSRQAKQKRPVSTAYIAIQPKIIPVSKTIEDSLFISTLANRFLISQISGFILAIAVNIQDHSNMK